MPTRAGSVAIALLLLGAAVHPLSAQSQASTRLRVDRLEAPGGSEVDTLMYALPDGGGDLPLVSILIDTLGDSDPTNDTMRNVWVLTYARPSLLQRIVAGLPFVYVHPGSPHPDPNAVPAPILDMSAEGGRNTCLTLLHSLTQAEFLDPAGLPVRATTRAYWGNATDFRNEHVWSALPVLAAADRESAVGALSHDEMERLQARLQLSTRLFGDLVSRSYLHTAFEKERNADILYRQHNWDMLRQLAEQNGLYFQPLTLGLSKDANALLWAERHPAAARQQVEFDSKYLGIANPFEGSWLEKWKGYTEQWTLDQYGSRVAPGAPGSHVATMVPVALYTLDYPKAPLLLVDFRQPSKPMRREAFSRGVDQLTTGILGLTTFGNLEFFAAKTTYTFVQRRHGAAVDRSARLRAYAQLQHSLFLDDSLDPKLRSYLLSRVNGLALNPFDDSMKTEAALAREQYAALRAYVLSPEGLAREVDRARSREVASHIHSKGQIALYRVATISTLGLYRHTDRMTPELLAQVDRQRRFAWHKRFLEQVIDSTPPAEVAYDTEQVQRSIDVVTTIGAEDPGLRASSEALVRRVLAQTEDESTRRRCFECLQRLALLKPAPIAAAAGS